VGSIPIEPRGHFPTIGYGTMLSDGDEKTTTTAAVKEAIKVGYRHFDCSPVYKNEKEVGDAFSEALRHHHLKRKELFVTSKLWDHDWNDPFAACKKTLADLQLDYLDLYLVHWPFENLPPKQEVKEGKEKPEHIGYDEHRYLAVWREMERLVDAGLVRAIGVSNMTKTKLQRLIPHCRIKPAVNQVEGHPYLQQPDLVRYCKSEGVIVSTYFSVGAPGRSKNIRGDKDPVLLEDPTIVQIAKELHVTPAQVLLNWALRRGTVPIAKSYNPKRILENWNAYHVPLTHAHMLRINKLNRNFRFLRALFMRWPMDADWRTVWDYEYVQGTD